MRKKVVVKYFKLIIFIAIVFTLMAINIHLHRRKLIKDFINIRLDKSLAPNESQIYQIISSEMPYLPIEDLTNDKYRSRNLNQSCACYPSLTDVQIHNDYWQEFHNTNITYYIYGAYLDNRPTVVKNEPMVRILTMIHFIAPTEEEYPKTYCQFWYEQQSEPIIMPVKEVRKIWYYEWGHGAEHNFPHLLGCALPEEHKDWIPRTVSLVSTPCDKATNNIRLTYLPLKGNEVKKGFAVCIKGLDYLNVDFSHRLVEYIETMRALGVGKIIMYNLQIHPNSTKVLKYYEKTGIVEFRPISSSLERGNSPVYRHLEMKNNDFGKNVHEPIPLNDCLYRNIYKYNYVLVADIDEIPMPLGNFSDYYNLMKFGETIETDNCKKFSSFCFRCIYFPRYPEKPKYTNDIPEYFYMLQHVERVRDHLGPDFATKCFHNTDRVIATHNHFPHHWAWDVCPSYSFNATHAQMNHYREPDNKETLDDPVIDKSLWQFKDVIMESSMKVFEELNFFEKD